MKLRDVLGVLRDSYCRNVGLEYMHIQDPEQRHWLQQRVEKKAQAPDRHLQLHVLKKPTFSTGAVAWSGDGRRLAYQTEAGGAKSKVFVVGADGSAPKQILPAG